MQGENTSRKGQCCYTPKCAFERRAYPPGEHGRQALWRRRRVSEYWKQLREKQKTRRVYNVTERQFRRYYRKAQQQRGLTGQTLLVLLERRLDNVIYRLNFAESRHQARMLVAHGHVSVNGRRTAIPSMPISPGEVCEVRGGSANVN